MKILIDINHPAHVHFFKIPINILTSRGHDILITSRTKEMATSLLDALGVEHITLSVQNSGSFFGLCREYSIRNWKLYQIVRQFRPDIITAIGGIFVSHVGFLTRVPSLVFYDTENARLQNMLTYPLATRIYVPECYKGWTPKDKTYRYPGYHELSYLHPKYFVPNQQIAIDNGLADKGDTFLIRLVSWKANHDVGEQGWSEELLRHTLKRLGCFGSVLISSETALPQEFAEYAYKGDPEMLHHVMAFCRGFIGESATMASECAVLGVPAVYAAHTQRGYTDEQELKYGLVRNVSSLEGPVVNDAIDWMLDTTDDECQLARERLLEDTVDVAQFVVSAIEHPHTRLR